MIRALRSGLGKIGAKFFNWLRSKSMEHCDHDLAVANGLNFIYHEPAIYKVRLVCQKCNFETNFRTGDF